MSEPHVAIIIVNYNSALETLRCLQSLEGVEHESLHVIVVENNSTDHSYRMLNKHIDDWSFPCTVLQNEENRGFAGGVNVGIGHVRDSAIPFDYVVLLNPDTVVAPSFLDPMIATAEDNPRVAAVGALIYYLDDDIRTNTVFFAGGRLKHGGMRGVHVGLGEQDHGQFGKEPYRTEFVTGACMLMPRRAIQNFGLLEEDYFLYYEDVDWCLLAQREGWECFVVPTAHVWHEGSTSTKEGSPSYVYYHVRNGIMLARRHGCSFCALMRSIGSVVKQWLKLLIPGKQQWARATLYGLWDGWRGRMGPYRQNRDHDE